MPRITALNILTQDEGKEYLAELYGKTIENVMKGLASIGMKNADLSGDPASGSVEAKRFVNATSQAYGTARAAGAGKSVKAKPVTVKIDNDREIVEELEEKDEEQAVGFIEELCKNPTLTEKIGAALPMFAVPNTYGKYWYHIGDSNSQWMGGSVLADDTDTGFLLTAARKNGIAKFTNASMAGASWAYRVDYEDSLNAQCGIARVDELVASGEAPDIITILLGTNSDDDAGTADNTAADTYTTAGAIRYCLEKLLAAFPTSAIGVMLPMQRAETWKHQEEKNALIEELCRYYGVPVLDLFHEGQIVPDSKLTAYDDGHEGVIYTDSAHITTVNGVAQLGRKISEWLNRI